MDSIRLRGQSLVEFALILPIFVLIVVGIFDLGRAFFAYIAIANAAREGVRVYTFDKEGTSINDIYSAIYFEIGSSTVVDLDNIDPDPPLVECVLDPVTHVLVPVVSVTNCVSEEPIRVTITYIQPMILSFFFPSGLTLERSAEMMVP